MINTIKTIHAIHDKLDEALQGIDTDLGISRQVEEITSSPAKGDLVRMYRIRLTQPSTYNPDHPHRLRGETVALAQGNDPETVTEQVLSQFYNELVPLIPLAQILNTKADVLRGLSSRITSSEKKETKFDTGSEPESEPEPAKEP